ncbi:MAG: sugar phosphate isomerase/epimerase [Chloroflexota bacterium]|nr:sugar phosphate isomerase/epimerase [Chloroflexota bacterium]
MIALSTGSLYSYGTVRAFEMAAKAGYDGIEVLVDHRWDTRQPAYLRRLSADCGLPIAVVHSPFAVAVPDWPFDQLGRLRRTVVLAREVGASTVVTHLPSRLCTITGRWYRHGHRPRRFRLPVPLPRRESYYHFLHNGLAELEAETGITVGVENMPAQRFLGLRINGYWYNSPAELSCLPHLTLDTTHLGTWDLDPLVVYGQLRERVVHVHLSNYDGREHRSPPDGRLPLAEFLRHLARDGYQGAITVESNPEALGAGDEAECLAALRRALAFCRNHFIYSHTAHLSKGCYNVRNLTRTVP